MAYKIKLKNPRKEVYRIDANNKEQALHFFEENELIVNHVKEGESFEVEKSKEESTDNSPQFLVNGYKWLDKVNGNTYHSVIITDLKTGNEIYRSPTMVYGYGEQWKHTAYDELKKKGLVTEEDRFNHDLNRKRFIYNETNVSRKKDLF